MVEKAIYGCSGSLELFDFTYGTDYLKYKKEGRTKPMSYRVIRVKTFDGLAYRIEDVRFQLASHGFTVDPIVYHPQGLLHSDSVHGLKEILHEMLLACDEPVLAFSEPELREV